MEPGTLAAVGAPFLIVFGGRVLLWRNRHRALRLVPGPLRTEPQEPAPPFAALAEPRASGSAS